jgi:prepilin-type N-terminal cleavage/methylation domain-containing protein
MHERRTSPTRPGFSLLELLVVVTIILIVLSIVIATLVKVWHVVESFRH